MRLNRKQRRIKYRAAKFLKANRYHLVFSMSPPQIYLWVCCHWSWLPAAWPCLACLSSSLGSSVGYHGGNAGSHPPPRRLMHTSTQQWAPYWHSLHPDSQFTQPWILQRTTAVNPPTAPHLRRTPRRWHLSYQWKHLWLPCPHHPSWPHLRQLWKSATRPLTSHWTPNVKVVKMGFTPTLVCNDKPQNLHLLGVPCLKSGQ